MPRPPRAQLHRRHAWTALLAFATLLGACSPAGPTGPGAETLAALRVTVGTATPHTPTTLTISAIGNRGSDPLTTFDGTVALTVDAGAIDLASLGLTDGRGQTDLTFTGVVAPVTLTASTGATSASVVVDLQPLTAVPGDPGAPLSDALPYLAYVPRSDEYATGAPDLPGVPLSRGTVIALLAPATTIAEFDALLQRHDAGLAGLVPDPSGSVGALVALRLPSSGPDDHLDRLTALMAEPRIASAHRDRLEEVALASPQALPRPTVGEPLGWTWDREDEDQPLVDANWGLEFARVPQAWNLAALAASGPGNLVGVLDSGFVDTHPDLDLVSFRPAPTPEDADHGMHVAGTIGASFGNGVGVDGVQPFARIVGRRYDGSSTWGMIDFVEIRADLAVINASLGSNWYQYDPAPNPQTSAAIQSQMIAEGATFGSFLLNRTANGLPSPYLVVAAGNDSGEAVFGGADIEARWSSAYTNAALQWNVPGILVVEAVDRDADGRPERASFSNVGGHVSAPGVAITSLGASAPYLELSGTSMATPHVTGLLAFLLELADGDLTTQQVVDALRATTVAAATPNTAPAIDAFAAALALDVQLGEPRGLRHLADVDDGTLDGNQRVDPFDGSVVTADTTVARAGIALGPVGDDRLDLRDFRRFRDALLAAEDAFDLDLDGAPAHPKRDLNGDGVVDPADVENVFPRFDLNGDGRIDRTATHPVGGLLLGQPRTDLQVLQFLWDDAEVAADDLPALLDSGDVHLDAAGVFTDLDVVAVEVAFEGAAPFERRLEPEEPLRIATLPVGAYATTVRFLGAGDAVLGTVALEVAVALGGDVGLDLGALVAPGWSQRIGTNEDDEASDVALDALGNVYVVGTTQGLLDDRPGIVPLGIKDAFVRKLDASGQVLWTRQFGTEFNDQNNQVAVDATGHVLVASQQGSSNALLVVKFDPDGDEVWRADGPFNTFVTGLAVDADGSAYVVGGTGNVTSFVVKFTSAGALEWQRSIPTSTARAVAIDADGLVVVVGGATAALDGDAFGSEDAFVRWFDAAGEVVRTLQFGTAAIDNLLGVALAPDGRLFVAGSTRGALVPEQGSPGTLDGFVRLLEPDGTEVWTRQYGTPGADFPTGIAARPDGGAVVAGWSTGALAGPNQGGLDVAVLWFGADGAPLGGQQFGTAFDEYGLSVAADAGGAALIVGYAQGTTDLFGPGLGGFGSDAFVARVLP